MRHRLTARSAARRRPAIRSRCKPLCCSRCSIFSKSELETSPLGVRCGGVSELRATLKNSNACTPRRHLYVAFYTRCAVMAATERPGARTAVKESRAEQGSSSWPMLLFIGGSSAAMLYTMPSWGPVLVRITITANLCADAVQRRSLPASWMPSLPASTSATPQTPAAATSSEGALSLSTRSMLVVCSPNARRLTPSFLTRIAEWRPGWPCGRWQYAPSSRV